MHAYTCGMQAHTPTNMCKVMHACKEPCMCPEVLTSSIDHSTIFFKFLILLNYNCKDVFDSTL